MNNLTKDEILEELNMMFHYILNTDYCQNCNKFKRLFCGRNYCKAIENIARDITEVINVRKINE